MSNTFHDCIYSVELITLDSQYVNTPNMFVDSVDKIYVNLVVTVRGIKLLHNSKYLEQVECACA